MCTTLLSPCHADSSPWNGVWTTVQPACGLALGPGGMEQRMELKRYHLASPLPPLLTFSHCTDTNTLCSVFFTNRSRPISEAVVAIPTTEWGGATTPFPCIPTPLVLPRSASSRATMVALLWSMAVARHHLWVTCTLRAVCSLRSPFRLESI